MIVERRENGRVDVSMSEEEFTENRFAIQWYKDHRSKTVAKANRAVRKYREDRLIEWILRLNDFTNKLIVAHKKRAWQRALEQAENE